MLAADHYNDIGRYWRHILAIMAEETKRSHNDYQLQDLVSCTLQVIQITNISPSCSLGQHNKVFLPTN